MEEALNLLGFEGGFEFRGIDKIIFNGISRPDDFHLFKPLDRPEHADLDIQGKACRNPVGIDLCRHPAIGFKKDLMSLLVCKADDFILDRRTIPRTDSLDDSAVEGRAVEPALNDLVGRFIRVGQVTGDLLCSRFLGVEKEKGMGFSSPYWGVSLAKLMVWPSSLGVVPVLSLPTRNPSFLRDSDKPTDGGSPTLPEGKWVRPIWTRPLRKVPGARIRVLVKISSPRWVLIPMIRLSLDQDLFNRGLLHEEIFLILNRLFHPKAIVLAVDLGPRRPDGRPFSGIELPELDACFVRRPGHLSAQGVDFLDQMAFGQSADGRIAGHVTDLIDILGDEKGWMAHPGRSQGGLNPGMTSSHHNDIISFAMIDAKPNV